MFAEGKYPQAVEAYTKGIEAAPSAVLYGS